MVTTMYNNNWYHAYCTCFGHMTHLASRAISLENHMNLLKLPCHDSLYKIFILDWPLCLCTAAALLIISCSIIAELLYLYHIHPFQGEVLPAVSHLTYERNLRSKQSFWLRNSFFEKNSFNAFCLFAWDIFLRKQQNLLFVPRNCHT